MPTHPDLLGLGFRALLCAIFIRAVQPLCGWGLHVAPAAGPGTSTVRSHVLPPATAAKWESSFICPACYQADEFPLPLPLIEAHSPQPPSLPKCPPLLHSPTQAAWGSHSWCYCLGSKLTRPPLTWLPCLACPSHHHTSGSNEANGGQAGACGPHTNPLQAGCCLQSPSWTALCYINRCHSNVRAKRKKNLLKHCTFQQGILITSLHCRRKLSC